MSRILKNYKNQITQKYLEGIHNGIDLVGYKYSIADLIAHSDGIVIDLRTSYTKTDKTGHSYGNYILLEHSNGYRTMYAHIKYGSIKLKKGDKVKQGEYIGRMGATGHSTGVHLHFEVRKPDNSKIDPTKYINADLPEIKKESDSSQTTQKDEELLTLIRRTIRGDFGNHTNRKNNLVSLVGEEKAAYIQKQVNKNVNNNNWKWSKIRIYED